MSTPVMVLDAGNAIVKAKNKSGYEVQFPHAIARIADSEYTRIKIRNPNLTAADGYMRINGVPYAIGEVARYHKPQPQPKGADRYKPDHYGVIAAATMRMLYNGGGGAVSPMRLAVYGSHAPRDIDYRDDLMDAVYQQWEVEVGSEVIVYEVVYANAFDEGLGGWANVVLADDASHYRYPEVNQGRVLILDIGGLTTDFIGIRPGGHVDYSVEVSEEIGIKQAIRILDRSVRKRYSAEFKMTDVIDEGRLEMALATGVLAAGGAEWDVAHEAAEARNMILNRVRDAYQDRAGGPLNWDHIIITGGGCGLLVDHLYDLLNHGSIVHADDLDCIQFANVRGGLKLYRLMEERGMLR